MPEFQACKNDFSHLIACSRQQYLSAAVGILAQKPIARHFYDNHVVIVQLFVVNGARKTYIIRGVSGS